MQQELYLAADVRDEGVAAWAEAEADDDPDEPPYVTMLGALGPGAFHKRCMNEGDSDSSEGEWWAADLQHVWDEL